MPERQVEVSNIEDVDSGRGIKTTEGYTSVEEDAIQKFKEGCQARLGESDKCLEWEGYNVAEYVWERYYRRLQDFHAEHGHCNATYLSGDLGRWACCQRRARKNPKCRRPLSDPQIQRLDTLGFTWDARDWDGMWDDMYLQLVDYYKEHGHARVPSLSGKLGKWVRMQRQCKNRNCGSNRQLTREQIDRLDAIEMVWRADENVETWEAMYEKLKGYKAAKGDCLVPQTEGKLGRWVESQRMRKKRQVGRQKKLTQEQVELLDDIGFAWSAKERFLEIWEQKFTQLEAFSHEHGHCQVPRRRNDGNLELPSLARWVEEMRGIYKGSLKGKAPLTEDQIQRLEALGCFQGIVQAAKR
eukprot:Nitzschia sp. Nitz4//scaffold46_size129759//12831//13895//NITZ4_003481-RA/size129759-processed-gene-0.152-mRNA-1//-1//CDS//3329552535//6535//frame0